MVVPQTTQHTECFLSGGVTTLICSWKEPTPSFPSPCAHQSLGTQPCVSKKYECTGSEPQTHLSINDHPQRRQQTRSHIETQTCTHSHKHEWSALLKVVGLAGHRPQCGPDGLVSSCEAQAHSTTSFDNTLRDALKGNDQDSFHNTFPRPVYKDSVRSFSMRAHSNVTFVTVVFGRVFSCV